MSEQRDQTAAGEESGDEGGQQPPDLSVPMWVWTLLGFVLVVAVIIVVIIWGGGQTRPAEQGTEEPAQATSATDPSSDAAEAPTTNATQPG